jgi:LmbE family N-acetylglucosaminyl deacetylase
VGCGLVKISPERPIQPISRVARAEQLEVVRLLYVQTRRQVKALAATLESKDWSDLDHHASALSLEKAYTLRLAARTSKLLAQIAWRVKERSLPLTDLQKLRKSFGKDRGLDRYIQRDRMRSLILALLFMIPASMTLAEETQAPHRILFVAPHPDDETLGTGGQIFKAQSSPDTDYRVVVLTCGDAYRAAFEAWTKSGNAKDLNNDGAIDYLDLGIARHNETLTALSLLGVPESKVIFLGYPDGGLDKLDGKTPYESPFTRTASVPYSFAYHMNAPYLAESVVSDLVRIMTEFDPQTVYSTTPTDENRDHKMTREFVVRALQRSGVLRTHLEYLIHWELHEPGWPLQTQSWMKPKGHVSPDATVPLLNFGMSAEFKSFVISRYVTQMAVSGDYLPNFAKDSEVFWNSRASIEEYLENQEVRESLAAIKQDFAKFGQWIAIAVTIITVTAVFSYLRH